jgi:hypothetical protein
MNIPVKATIEPKIMPRCGPYFWYMITETGLKLIIINYCKGMIM